MTGGRVVLPLLALVLVAGAAHADLPREASFVLDGVQYEYAAGVLGSGNVTLLVDGEERLLPSWRTCAFVMLHPGTPNGRVLVPGLYGAVATAFDVDQFVLPNGTLGYAYDALVEADGAEVLADVAFGGNATLKAASSKYRDPVGSTGIPDLDKDLPDLRGHVALTQADLRDDATGMATDGAGQDEELHVWVRSDPESPPVTLAFPFDSGRTYAPPTMLGRPSVVLPVPPTEAFGQLHPFENLKLGGQGRIDVTASAHAPPGLNRLAFEAIAPDGDPVGNFTVAPSAGQDDTQSLTFDLDQLGVYLVRVSGTVAAGSYEGTFTQAPPERLDLHLWWENVTYGAEAYQAYDGCKREVGGNKVVGVASVVDRPQPPGFRLGLVATGVAGGAAVVGIAVKLASDQLALGLFRKSK